MDNYESRLRFSKLVRELVKILPDIKLNTTKGEMWDLDKKFPEIVSIPEKGLFQLLNGMQKSRMKLLKILYRQNVISGTRQRQKRRH